MRVARAAACASLLAVPAMAMADGTASIRVEGANGTLLTERTANVPSGGTATLVNSFDPQVTNTVPNNRATSLLVRAILDSGLRVGFTLFGSLTYINRIEGDAEPSPYVWGTSPWWLVKVNHAQANVGSDGIVIRPGDEIVWSFSAHPDDEMELAVTGPANPVAIGTQFAVHVDRYDNGATAPGPYGQEYTGVANPPQPAAGVTVSYAGQTATTDAAGNASLTAASGWGTVVATAPNSIRDQARTCGFPAGSPEACGLDPLVQRLPDVAPGQNISSVPPNRVKVTTSTGRTIDIDLPSPTRGGAPVSISADGLDPSLTPAERREVLGRLASSLAWQLNARAARGDEAVAPPTGTRWRGAWLGRATTVAPLAPGEAVVRQRAQSAAGHAAAGRAARAANDRLAECGLDARAVSVKRFGYAMVVVKAPAAGARACLARRT